MDRMDGGEGIYSTANTAESSVRGVSEEGDCMQRQAEMHGGRRRNRRGSGGSERGHVVLELRSWREEEGVSWVCGMDGRRSLSRGGRCRYI